MSSKAEVAKGAALAAGGLQVRIQGEHRNDYVCYYLPCGDYCCYNE